MENYEKLGAFYLGRIYDVKAGETKDDLLLYDSKDLTTHAVCVGMTGSGKTGLCVSLIEEAAIDGIPAIIIDPKGDLGNLALTFPNLKAEDFLPWINPDEANNKGLTPEEYASKQAAMWKKGIGSWGQDGSRIQRLKDAADVAIYTPGSNAGIPVSILKSFAAPDQSILEDDDLLSERISTTVSSLLGLIGIDADPIQSKEHILLSTILDQAWRQKIDLDLASLIQQVQSPPVSKIGVLDMESFYPAKERFGLVMALNNIIASPGFATWLKGVPLDINNILYTPGGKPRIAIFSIAHLSDPERMFFVALLMNQIQSWMRSQSGTTSLRALVYMDEIYGYLPPTSNPPSKKPLMTMLKQARAFGVGLILATQNPVDLDYKALSNAGTWFVGRLQTERDKNRLLDGLDSVSSGGNKSFNRKEIAKTISSLDSRVFLLNNTHEDAPEIFHTRWVLSYLRGPITRDQIKKLMDPVKDKFLSASEEPNKNTTTKPAQTGATTSGIAAAEPQLPPDIQKFYLPTRGSAAGKKLIYKPALLGIADVLFSNAKKKIDFSLDASYLTPITDNVIPVSWEDATELDIPANDLEKIPEANALFADLPPSANKSKSYTTWEKEFGKWLYGTQRLELFKSPSLKEISQVGESERDFRIRMQQKAREKRDEEAETLRKKYAKKIATLQERLRKANAKIEKQAEQAKKAKLDTALSIGATLLGAFTGRKILSQTNINKAKAAMRASGKVMDEGKDVERAQETADAIQQQIAELQVEFETETAQLQEKTDLMTEELETILIKPKKSDITIKLLSLVWTPYWKDENGIITPAW
jgi:hypothetical protein